MTPKQIIGYNLKRIREQQGLSQDKLGKLLGYSQHQIWRWEENGNIQAYKLPAFCAILNTPVEEFYRIPK